MFSIWSNLNSSQSDPKYIQEIIKNQKQSFLSPLNSYYRSQQGDKKDNPNLNKNENDVVKKISNYLNLDQESCAENYLLYKDSPFNHFIISSDLLEKLQVDELFSAHFLQFVNFYYRERYSFLKIVKLIISVTAENSYLNYNDDEKPPQLTLKDYELLCKEIKNFSNKKHLDLTNTENFQEKNFTQLLKELELNLEIILMLTNLVNIDLSKFQEILKNFTTHSIVKYLNTSAVQTISQFALLIDQIINLHSLVIIKSLRLDKVTGLSLTNDTESFTFEDKNKLLSQDTKTQMNEFIQSFNSNQKSSPIILTWSTLLYNLSIDPELSKVFTTELKSLTNRMFSLSIKENVFVYLLDLIASDIYKNQDLIWYVKQIIYEVLNSVLHSFDENSLGDILKFIYELTFFCMHKNQVVCEHFWRLCKLPDRDNLTILIFYSLETFPISFSLSLTFFSLIAKTSPELCKQVFEYLTQMDQFCEYLENLSPHEYMSSGEEIQLTKPRRLFDTVQLAPGKKGTILSHLASANSNIAHRMILQNQAVNWNVPFNCLDLIQTYLNKINFAASQNNLISDNNIISIIQLIDSLFKYFFDIDDLTESYTYDLYTKYMEMYVSSCLMLFTHLINFESTDSYRLISKLLEFFINISPSIYDKLIRLMQQTNLIGHPGSYNKMNIEELFNNRLNLVKSSGKILFLFKSQDYDLIINYFKFIQCIIKESGNNMEYLSPLCAVLAYVFPEIFKWNNSMINLNIDLSITCLNLLHTVLNTSLVPSFANTEFMRNFSALHSDSVVSIDQFCESVLLNTECSESILNLIYTAYECSQDLNFLNEIKKLDNILIQSISLINRLMFLSDDAKTEDYKLKESIVSQSNLYFLLVKSISQQNQVNTTATTFQSSLLNGSSSTSSNEIITKNNQFLLQLNLMMSQTNPYLNKNLTVLNSAAITDNKNELNWFHLLTKLAIYKSNQSLDCLIFSIFKKISQLTPRLFGSLLGPYTQQMHTVILSKLKSKQNGQIISILSDFICSLIENQPGFFQILADLKIEATKEETKKDASDLNETFIEGNQSILKELFELVSRLEKSNKSSEDYCVSLSGVVSIFYTMWSNKKINYMNYCKQKSQFWPLLSSILSIIKKDLSKSDQVKHDDEQFIGVFQEYLEYFGDEYFTGPYANFDSFEQFILDANIKSASCAFKIFSYELFELIYRKNVDLSTSDLAKIFKEKIIDKKLIEKWLDFYVYQLKRDMEDEAQSLISHAESIAVNDEKEIKPDMSIINPSSLKFKRSTPDDTKKKLKSKSLLDSIKMLLLLINKTTRLINTSKPSENKKVIFFQEKLSTKQIDMDCVLTSLLNSLQQIINHFLSLNDALLSLQQEQKLYHPLSKNNDFFLNSCKKISSNLLTNNSKDSNFITLKQSNEIVKEFHSISNLIMILITSVNDSDCFNNSEKLTKNLINLLEQLILEDFNYFPAIINSIQTCLLHLVNLNKVETVCSMEKNESLLKKLLHNCCKIFSKSIANLEDESILKSSLIKDTILTFVLNNDLIKFLIGNFEEKYWLNELVESCIIQCLYGLFEKYIHKQDMSDAMYSILDLFFALANNHVELLAKSDFNTRTCLLASKLFEYSAFVQKQSASKQLELEKGTTKWSNVLKIYINIQTTLIEKLKYKYLKDSILFFGSYFETMVQIATTLHHSLDLDLLDTIRAFSRYLAQISLYTKELLLNIQNSTQHLESLFTSIIQLCIMKLSHVRIVSMKAHHNLQTTMGSYQGPLSKLAPDDLVNIQNLLFSIISLNLSGLFNFAPNFADPNYLIKLDEYRPILAFQLAPPSSFDSHSTLSFGSILWLIDFILKILHKYDLSSSTANISVLNSTVLKNTTIISSNLTPNKRVQDIINSGNPNSTLTDTSPKKNVSILEDTHIETKLPSKSLIVCVLEKCLNVLLSQIVLCEKVSNISSRDKKLLKRELNSEINSIIQGLGRSLKKQTTLSQHPAKSPTTSAIGLNAAASSQAINNLISTGSKQTYEFFKCIQFVLQQNVN